MLSPIQVGDITIQLPVFLAPMAGVSDPPFRSLVRSFGPVVTVSEMVSSNAVTMQGSTHQAKNLRKTLKQNQEFPLMVQIFGNDPHIMAEAAKINVDAGADIIDLNFGCPVKKVVKGFAGSALMQNEPLAAEIFRAVVKAVKVPVTVKMRMGWDAQHLNAPQLAHIAEDNGLQMVAVHGRTRAQLYSGTADWEFIAQVKQRVQIPVIANGDIRNTNDALACLQASGADGIMIGRGAFGKPWMVAQIATELQGQNFTALPMTESLWPLIERHLKDVEQYYGAIGAIGIAKKHLGWYSNGRYNSNIFRQQINLMTRWEDILSLSQQFFSDSTNDPKP